MHPETRLLRSLVTPAEDGTPLHASPVFAAPFHVRGEPGGAQYSYGRSHSPTWTALESALGGLEAGEAGDPVHVRVFGSGMTAIASVFGAVLAPGAAVVLAADAYYTARLLLEEHWAPLGVELREVPAAAMSRPAELEPALRGARLLWLETPSNPMLAVCDLRELSALAHRHGVLAAVDNTTATPLAQPALQFGADLSVVSDTKLVTGHSDLLLGHVATRDHALIERIDRWRTLHGGGPGPMDAWLALRSMATLPLRLERCCANAQRIAEFLRGHAGVIEVFYPGLPAHPSHALARAQMSHFGPLVSFTLRDRDTAERFLAAAQLITEASSFGGVCTTAERRARWGHDAVPKGFIRLSAGCEAAEDLIADLAQALDAAGS